MKIEFHFSLSDSLEIYNIAYEILVSLLRKNKLLVYFILEAHADLMAPIDTIGWKQE